MAGGGSVASRSPGDFPRRAVIAAWLLFSGCVTTYETIEPLDEVELEAIAAPVVIPFPQGTAGRTELITLYTQVLQQLQDAAAAGDLAMVESLLAAFDRDDLPESLRGSLRNFRSRAHGIAFEQHLEANATLALRPQGAAVPDLGQPLELELQVPAPRAAVRLGGADDPDPIGILVSVAIQDEFADGSSRTPSAVELQRLPTTFDLAGARVLSLPVRVDVPAEGVVRRQVRLEVEWMPGFCEVEVPGAGERTRAPLRRIAIARGTFWQYPRGYALLAAEPLRALRAALADFSPERFGAVWLAAQAMPREDRDEAIGLLLDQVRFGAAAQAQVAMAALKQLTGRDLPIGDRDAWLNWQQSRR